jgi:hypothetical protein
VSDKVLVTVFDTRKDLLEVETPDNLLHLPFLVDQAEKLTFRSKFHHNENVIKIVKHFVKLDYVGMVEVPQEPDLALCLR